MTGVAMRKQGNNRAKFLSPLGSEHDQDRRDFNKRPGPPLEKKKPDEKAMGDKATGDGAATTRRGNI